MNLSFDILAAQDGGRYVEIVILLVLVLLSALGGLLQKVMKKQEKKRAEEQRGLGRTPPPPPPKEAAQAKAIEEIARAAKQAMGIEPPQAQAPEPRARERIRRHEPLREPVQEAPRPTVQMPGATTEMPKMESQEHIGPVAPLEEVASNLRKRASARRAIIFSEILAPPKALRQGGEKWNL